ncbi:MAG TPA: dTDP-4-dehydrorhamnose 3,5-epimerase family protein [Steroidobacteraceae bacterium]|nr:dTDP-4-dehydrorhamnose 3,5-epimerase family protein [Steroidobacteraceae bacterium]
MQFQQTSLRGAFVVSLEPYADSRGFFARTWCAREFAAHGLPDTLVQSSMSHSERRGTVRGMHVQLPPSREAKLVRCTRGAIYDVIVDMDPDSPTFLRHFGIELSATSYQALYIPPLMLHGFQTLQDASEVHYQMTDFYAPELGFGARWDDPAFGIAWPIRAPVTILPRDAAYADFDVERYRRELDAARARGARSSP